MNATDEKVFVLFVGTKKKANEKKTNKKRREQGKRT
jgi:hypothetical protein